MKLPSPMRRAAILTAAIRLANTHGLEEVSYQTVSLKANVKPRTVRAYFHTRRALWVAVVADNRCTVNGEDYGL